MASIPNDLAIFTFLVSKSNPITWQPFAFNNCAVINPIRPKPTTTTVSPNVGLTNLIPWSPIDPITVNVASSSVTLYGILTTKFLGTQTISAWGPFDDTLSPIENSWTPLPTAITLPTLQYPSGIGCPSLLNTAFIVGFNPSVLILLKTSFTLSGCCFAFWNKFDFPNSTSIRSVPNDTKLLVVCIKTWPGLTNGAGISSKIVWPLLISWMICFINWII